MQGVVAGQHDHLLNATFVWGQTTSKQKLFHLLGPGPSATTPGGNSLEVSNLRSAGQNRPTDGSDPALQDFVR